MLDITRNQFLCIGLLIVLLGVQFRMVDTYVLNEDATARLARLKGNDPPGGTLGTWFARSAAPARKSVSPPNWLGWAALSVGGVIVMHALSMRQGGG